MMKSTKNNIERPEAPIDCVKDHNNPKVAMASRPRMKMSPRPLNWFHFPPSDAKSTRIENQNQYPPTQTLKAPSVQSVGQIVGVATAGVGYPKTMTTVAMT